MPTFIVLRVQREDNPTNRDECVVKFYPIKYRKTGENIVVEAPDESYAFERAVGLFPTFQRFLAVENLGTYSATVARVLAARVQRELAKQSPQPQGAGPSGGKALASRANIVRERGGEGPRRETDQASNPA